MSHAAAESLAEFASSCDLNEADTRFQIIDRLFQDVLGWPAKAVKLEVHNTDGYADYHLLARSGRPALIVEAKRTGTYFEIPPNFNHGKLYREVKVKALLTSPSLREALIQAQRYCADEGCEYGAVANGKQVILFRAFERGKPWKELPAIVISDMRWFGECHTEAVSLLGYTAVTEANSLPTRFQSKSLAHRELFFAKDKITAFNQIVNANSLAASLRPIVLRYFGPLDVEDAELIDRCYVNQRAYERSLKGIRSLIRDSVSPFMATYGVSETEDNKRGGALGNRLAKGVMRGGSGEVIVLFGGKGAGKSTFLKRVLRHEPPQYLKKHSTPIIIDLLASPKERTAVREFIWSKLVEALDSDGLLVGDRDRLLQLFEDRWITAARQDLFGFGENEPIYNERLNSLVATWKSDTRYVVGRLIGWHARHHRGVIVAIDNTDQLDNELQDFAFSVAEEISREFKCIVLISMREERFYTSKVRGMMDAYQNSAFHISSPSPADVFERRIEYVVDLLATKRIDVSDAIRADLIKFLRIFLADFRKEPASPLNRFISACAHGNIRLALDLFRDLIVSGYTNSREMTEISGTWTILIHQVIRPLMTPTRLFYSETLSRVPNLFQVRAPDGGSHFTGLRVLRLLAEGQDPASPAYISFAEVRAHFATIYGGDADVRMWIDRLLASNLIEASTRQDYYSEDIDAVRITAFGQFALDELHKNFTYVELVSTDCGLREEATCNQLVHLSNEEVVLLNDRRRYERVVKRLEKARTFVDYLVREEKRENEAYGLGSERNFAVGILQSIDEEEPRVLKSARRNAQK